MSYVVGLTGGIGSGKTVASDHFETIGVPVIDTDVIARKVVEPASPTLLKLVAAFGEEILLDDGNLNRAKLRAKAFSNKETKATLDNITHPAIRQETFHQIENVEHPYCIVVVPLLTADSSFAEFMHRILVVTTEHETKITRVQKRSNLRRDEVERIMATQLSDKQRLAFSDDVIANDGSIKDVKQKVEALHEKYLDLASVRD